MIWHWANYLRWKSRFWPPYLYLCTVDFGNIARSSALVESISTIWQLYLYYINVSSRSSFQKEKICPKFEKTVFGWLYDSLCKAKKRQIFQSSHNVYLPWKMGYRKIPKAVKLTALQNGSFWFCVLFWPGNYKKAYKIAKKKLLCNDRKPGKDDDVTILGDIFGHFLNCTWKRIYRILRQNWTGQVCSLNKILNFEIWPYLDLALITLWVKSKKECDHCMLCPTWPLKHVSHTRNSYGIFIWWR